MCTLKKKRKREFHLRFGAYSAHCDSNRYIKPMRKDRKVSRNGSEMFVCICVVWASVAVAIAVISAYRKLRLISFICTVFRMMFRLA